MRLTALVVAVGIVAVGCGGSGGSTASTSSSSSEPPSTTTAPPITTTPPTGSSVLLSFAEPASVAGWINVDDTVMGGVSDSTTRWEAGRLVFSGRVSLDNNGGFTSTIGPIDRMLGARAQGSNGLVLDVRGAGRTYTAWLRSGPNGDDRWVARFEPPDAGACCAVTIPYAEFRSVDRFLRPTTPAAPFDPATIVQIGFYLTDGRAGAFELSVASIAVAR